jgi:hypothetical protein
MCQLFVGQHATRHDVEPEDVSSRCLCALHTESLLCFCRVFSQLIATGQFDPTREDWQYQLRQLPAPDHREDDGDIRCRIRALLKSCEQRDFDRGFSCTITEDEAMQLFEEQARRCAITGIALSCLPLQLNTMR